jgi:hypothetical protein
MRCYMWRTAPAAHLVLSLAIALPYAVHALMPTVLRVQGLRFFFYMQEGTELAHIHVESGDGEAKFWLTPVVLAFSRGYADHELRRIERVIAEHLEELLDGWKRVHNS